MLTVGPHMSEQQHFERFVCDSLLSMPSTRTARQKGCPLVGAIERHATDRAFSAEPPAGAAGSAQGKGPDDSLPVTPPDDPSTHRSQPGDEPSTPRRDVNERVGKRYRAPSTARRTAAHVRTPPPRRSCGPDRRSCGPDFVLPAISNLPKDARPNGNSALPTPPTAPYARFQRHVRGSWRPAVALDHGHDCPRASSRDRPPTNHGHHEPTSDGNEEQLKPRPPLLVLGLTGEVGCPASIYQRVRPQPPPLGAGGTPRYHVPMTPRHPRTTRWMADGVMPAAGGAPCTQRRVSCGDCMKCQHCCTHLSSYTDAL